MRKIKLAAAVLAAITGLLAAPAAANAASVRPATGVYTASSMTRAFYTHYMPCSQGLCNKSGWVHFQLHTTYTASQIWINGSVSCSWGGAATVNITWCGVGGGNGTADLNVGLNWNVPAWSASGLYERMDVYADDYGCDTYGTNSEVGEIGSWAISELSCEQ